MKSFKLFTLALFAVLALPGLARAQSTTGKGQVKAFIVQGDVRLEDSNKTQTVLTRGQTFGEGNTIITGADGSALLVFSNGAAMKVGSNTTLQLIKFDQAAFDQSQGQFIRRTADPSKSTTDMDLKLGTLTGEVKKLNLDAGSTFTVDTPAGSAGIRGTIPTFSVALVNGVYTVTMSVGTGSVTFTPATVAALGPQLQKGPVQVNAGGQIVLTTTTNADGTISSLNVMGQAITSQADMQATINALYDAINTAGVEEAAATGTTYTPQTPPTAAPPAAPTGAGGTTTSTTSGNTVQPNTNPTIISQ